MTTVIDSSPWIVLSGLGILGKTATLFDEPIVPSSVYEEILRKKDRAAELLTALCDKNVFSIYKATDLRLLNALKRKLGKGESEAIALAVEMGADRVILDDHAARTEALRLGLEVKGTLGIIKRLMDLGKYECDGKDLYSNLKKMNFRVSNDVFSRIFEIS